MVLWDCVVYCFYYIVLSILHIKCVCVCRYMSAYVSVCCICVHNAHVCIYVMCPYMIYILLMNCAENVLKFCFIKKIVF